MQKKLSNAATSLMLRVASMVLLLRWGETQTEVVWTRLPCITSGQNHLARHSERGKKTKQTEKKVGRQHQGMDRPRVCQVPEGSGEQGKIEESGCEVICGTPITPMVKGYMTVKVRWAGMYHATHQRGCCMQQVSWDMAFCTSSPANHHSLNCF